MVVGVLRVYAHLYEPMSLKDKRRILKSVLAKVQNKFNVSAAEVDWQDHLRKTELGFSFVSNAPGHADSMMNAVVQYLESSPEYEITDVSTEIIHI